MLTVSPSHRSLIYAVQVTFLSLVVLGALAAAELPRPAVDLEVETVTGQIVDLEHLKGKVVVVMFFYSTCPLCHEATQNLNVIRRKSIHGLLLVIAASSLH